MRWIVVTPTGAVESAGPTTLPTNGWVWLDATHEEVAAEPQAFADAVESLTGHRLFDLHLQLPRGLQQRIAHALAAVRRASGRLNGFQGLQEAHAGR